MSGGAEHERSGWMDELPDGNRLVYSTTSFLKYPLARALERIARGGFRNVELWGNLKHLDPRNPQEDPQEVGRKARELGLRVTSLHAPFTMISSAGPVEKMRAWEELVLRSLGQAAALGAELLVVHPFIAGTDDSDDDYRAIVGRTEDALARIAGEAGRQGLRVAVENMPGHRTRRYGRVVEELHRFVAGSGLDNLGLCLDTGHVIFNHGDPVEELERFGDRIFSIHLNDNIRGAHLDLHLVPGVGSVDWVAFRLALARSAFRGLIVLELDSRGRPSSVFDEAREFVRNYFFDPSGSDSRGEPSRHQGAQDE